MVAFPATEVFPPTYKSLLADINEPDILPVIVAWLPNKVPLALILPEADIALTWRFLHFLEVEPKS